MSAILRKAHMTQQQKKLLSDRNFTVELRRLNGFSQDELREWLFLPGMKFGDTTKWWKAGNNRPRPHEGLDLVTYLDRKGDKHLLPPGTLIPPLMCGIEVARIPDSIGETVILGHEHFDLAGRKLHTFYAHLTPTGLPATVATMTPGSTLGTIAARDTHGASCPSHLHLSLAWIAQSFSLEGFDWQKFSADEKFHPGDPLELL